MSQTRQPPEAVLDVRPLLAAGQEPRPAILSALEGLRPGEALQVITPFEPLPLLSLATSLGFEAVMERVGPGTFCVRLVKLARASSEQVELDLRNLQPPEPMRQALAAMEHLGRGQILLLHTRFRPVHLLEQLDGQGWLVETEEVEPDHWETTLARRMGGQLT